MLTGRRKLILAKERYANTIVVRASISDAADGGGIAATLNLYVNGVLRQALTFTSKYSWVYGVNGFTDNNPATGTSKRFYDEHRAFITAKSWRC